MTTSHPRERVVEHLACHFRLRVVSTVRDKMYDTVAGLGCRSEFTDIQTPVAQAIKRWESDDALANALDEVASQGGRVSARILGRWIERMAGRRIEGK